MPTMPMLILSLAPSTRPREKAAPAAMKVLRDEVDILIFLPSSANRITGMEERVRGDPRGPGGPPHHLFPICLRQHRQWRTVFGLQIAIQGGELGIGQGGELADHVLDR